MTFVEEQERGYKAARVARAELGLELSLPDIVDVIEDLAGIPVTVLSLPVGIAGLHGRTQGHDYIFLNGSESAVRLRFTLAHEYGHVRLGHAGSVDYTSDIWGGGRRPPTEVQADGFAAEFLAPVSAVRAWLLAAGEPPVSLETTVRLAHFFHVSAEVALYRLQAARFLKKTDMALVKDAIGTSEHTRLADRLGLFDVQDTLFLARSNLPRYPRSTITHALQAYERGLLSVEQVAELLEIEPARIRLEFERRGAVPPTREQDY